MDQQRLDRRGQGIATRRAARRAISLQEQGRRAGHRGRGHRGAAHGVIGEAIVVPRAVAVEGILVDERIGNRGADRSVAAVLAAPGDHVGTQPPVVHRPPTAKGRHRAVVGVDRAHGDDVLGRDRRRGGIVLLPAGRRPPLVAVGPNQGQLGVGLAAAHDAVDLAGHGVIVALPGTVGGIVAGHVAADRVVGNVRRVGGDGRVIVGLEIAGVGDQVRRIPLERDEVGAGRHTAEVDGGRRRHRERAVAADRSRHVGGVVAERAGLALGHPPRQVVVRRVH